MSGRIFAPSVWGVPIKRRFRRQPSRLLHAPFSRRHLRRKKKKKRRLLTEIDAQLSWPNYAVPCLFLKKTNLLVTIYSSRREWLWSFLSLLSRCSNDAFNPETSSELVFHVNSFFPFVIFDFTRRPLVCAFRKKELFESVSSSLNVTQRQRAWRGKTLQVMWLIDIFRLILVASSYTF